MAYDELLVDRVRLLFDRQGLQVLEKKMMGGLCFMLEEKMCCGVLFNKKKQLDLLMVRIGPDAVEASLDREGALPMDFTGRPMKGFLFVAPEGFEQESDLQYWVQLCIDFNPLAKKSSKKKKKPKKSET